MNATSIDRISCLSLKRAKTLHEVPQIRLRSISNDLRRPGGEKSSFVMVFSVLPSCPVIDHGSLKRRKGISDH
jgi:hypothetical protein